MAFNMQHFEAGGTHSVAEQWIVALGLPIGPDSFGTVRSSVLPPPVPDASATLDWPACPCVPASDSLAVNASPHAARANTKASARGAETRPQRDWRARIGGPL